MNNQSKPVILLADDDLDHRRVMRRVLEQKGFVIHESADAPSTIQSIRAHRPAVVVLDSMSPEGAGLECLRQIKGPEGDPAVQIIMCTANKDRSYVRTCLDAGCDAFIPKPFTEQVLLETIARVLQPEGEAPPPAAEESEEEVSDEDEDALSRAVQAAREKDTVLAAGEFEEADSTEEIDIPVGAAAACAKLKAPDPLLKMIQSRLAIFQELDRIADQRQVYFEDETIPEEIQSELRRQRHEHQNPPRTDAARAALEKRKEMLLTLKEKMKSEGAKPLDHRNLEIHGLALRQWALYIQHDEMTAPALAAALHLAENEPLYRLLRQHGIVAENLFAYAIYARALETLRDQQNAKRELVKLNVAGLEQENKGLLTRLRRQAPTEDGARQKLEGDLQSITHFLGIIARELRTIERPMVEAFWEAYEQSAALLVSGSVPTPEMPILRAFLRYGLLGVAPWFLPAELVKHILRECAKPVTTWDFSMDAWHVLYADEYIDLVSRYKCPPSVDEDLELNHQNTPEWKADKSLRRLINTHAREAALKELRRDLVRKVNELRQRQAEREEERDRLRRNDRDYKKRLAEFGYEIQHLRVESARIERAANRIQNEYLPRQMELREDAAEKMESSGAAPTSRDLALREARGIRRVSRLAAKLKEPFLPFVLRDHFLPGGGTINDRGLILEKLIDVESRDITIFKESLMPVKKQSQRIHLRFAPIVMLTPACGFMPYSWNPRTSLDPGRMVLPAYCPRPNLLERILPNLLADFRWDTSKAGAGIDLLTSDTLVAAYANTRWNFRKRKKDNREKSAIYMEESDRMNWRRHYALFLDSAPDAGKKLFYKCYEVYELVVKYLGLPDGMERLRR